MFVAWVSAGLALQLVLPKVMARAMAMFVAWEVVKTRKISVAIK